MKKIIYLVLWSIERRVTIYAFGGRFIEPGDGWLALLMMFFISAMIG